MERTPTPVQVPVLFLGWLFVCVAPAVMADSYVAPAGSDSAAGTFAHPFRTIQRGIDAVRGGGTVTVLPGTYTEELVITSRGPRSGPIVLRSAQPQAAVLDGAERVAGWHPVPGSDRRWTRDFGPAAPYDNDRGRWDLPPRSEQVFVEGRRCSLVREDTAPDVMIDYTFTATRRNPARYVLRLPAGTDPNLVRTEVTTRSRLLVVQADDVLVEGFVFRRARATYQQAMVTLIGDRVEFRGNVVEYCSAGSGLAVQTKHGLIRDNTLRHNGQYGFSMGGTENRIENNLVTGNDLAGYKEWGTGGTKIVGSGNIVRGNRFIGNLGGVAVWLDSGPGDNVIVGNYLSGNYGEGIRAEISFRSFIGYNIVEGTRPCTVTTSGRTRTHGIGISVQNSAETWVVNSFLKDNHDAGIQLFNYRRKATDLPRWQARRGDAAHRAWLDRSWSTQVVQAYGNRFFNNVMIQTSAEAAGPSFRLLGLLNGDAPHCYGNEIDYNFYWNAVTGAPQVQLRNDREVPDGRSGWQTRYGLDVHAHGGFARDAYRQPVFSAIYPYRPTSAFVAHNRGRALADLPWDGRTDYSGDERRSGEPVVMGHLQHAGE